MVRKAIDMKENGRRNTLNTIVFPLFLFTIYNPLKSYILSLFDFSSQIRIEGMASRSPKSLARKHIIIGQLAEEDL